MLGGVNYWNRHCLTRARSLWLGVCALLLAGCGTQFLYNRLPTLFYLYATTQVSLDGAQRQTLKAALRGFLVWHRRNELPRYAEFTEQLADALQQPIGVARIDAARLRIEAYWRASVLQGAPPAARWLATLRAAQRDQLFKGLNKDDAKLREEYCIPSEAERRKSRDKLFVDAVEDWTGDLSPAQMDLIRAHLAATRGTGCGYVDARAALRRDLRALVEQQPRDPGYVGQVAHLLAYPEERWPPRYREEFNADRDAIVALLGSLDATLTSAQRVRMIERLRDFAKDFRELAAR